MLSIKNFKMNCKLFVVFLISAMACSRATVDVPKSVKEWKYKLNTGELMPMIGFGTWQIKGAELIKQSLDYALGAGYRHIDTAQAYENEEDIGNALKELLPKYNLSRQDIFITSKINSRASANPDAYQAVTDSLKKLQTDYVDLYLIHNPALLTVDFQPDGPPKVTASTGPKNGIVRDEKWQGLVKAKKEGLVKSIGVSNYAVKHLNEVLANDHGVKPAVNQIAWNPFYQPRDILEFCKTEGILVVGYSSLGSSGDHVKIREDPRVIKIADKLGKSPSQVLLRWPLQDGIAMIPKSTSKKHIEDNISLDFVIPEEDVKVLNSFEQKPPLFDINNFD